MLNLKINNEVLLKIHHSVSILKSFLFFWRLNATLSNISAILWQPVLVVEEAGVRRENHRHWASNW
jgi:hypothetical protein